MASDAKITELITAIGKQSIAIDDLVKKLGGSGSGGGGGNNAGGNNTGGVGNAANAERERQEQERRRRDTQANAQAQVAANNSISNSVEKMLSNFDRLSNVGKSVFGSMEEYSAYASAKYDAIQEMFGGIPEDVAQAQTKTAQRAVRDIDNIYKVYLNNQHSFDGLMIERNGQTLNALEAFYKDEAEIASNYYEIRGELANRQTVKFNEMAQEDILKLSVMEKGFEISNQKVGQILERQISTTGEASTRIFDEISAYSKSVSKATGVSYKEIAGQISDIITDVERFGNVQVDEAARIAGALNELGLSYQGFGGMVDKFMNFDNAAESLGNLTTVFGVHFDAMEMMQLANEDQEEFLHRMRDAFLDSGKAVEDMTLAEKKLASQQMGMSIQDFENFMQEDRELSDLKSETAKVDEKEITKGF